jgi:hypothetical protein
MGLVLRDADAPRAEVRGLDAARPGDVLPFGQ